MVARPSHSIRCSPRLKETRKLAKPFRSIAHRPFKPVKGLHRAIVVGYLGVDSRTARLVDTRTFAGIGRAMVAAMPPKPYKPR